MDLPPDILSRFDFSWIGAAFSAAPPAKWIALAIGPTLAALAPLVRKWYPQWGGGRLILEAPLRKKVGFFDYWSYRSVYSVLPLVLGLSLVGEKSVLVALPLLSAGLSSLVWQAVRQRSIRGVAQFFEHTIRLNGRPHKYETISRISEVGGFEIHLDGAVISLTREDYERIRPSLFRYGYGESRPGWNGPDLK